MKKTIIIITAIVVAVSCHRKTISQTSETATTESEQKATTAISYSASVKTIIETKCAPCHIPSAGGSKADLSTYDATKKYADDIARRIQLGPGEMGFMPFRHDKLSDEEISTITDWIKAGYAQ